MGRELLLNAEFDLSLRPRWPGPSPAMDRQIRQMSWLHLLLAEPGDSVLVREQVPEEFMLYLERSGLPVPPVVVEPEVTSDARFSPFGWNRSAERLALRYAEPTPHPDVEVVRRVNGRSFAARLEGDELCDDTVVAVVEHAEEIGAVAELHDRPGPWLVKSEHGAAGLGNRRLTAGAGVDTLAATVAALLAEDDRVVIERWRRRILDLTATFRVTESGEAVDVACHEVVTTADGAFIGALLAPAGASPGLDPWRDRLTAVVGRTAAAAGRAGYHGEACLDAFVWRDDRGGARLRPLADLNARRHMSAVAGRLAGTLPRRCLYWRLLTRRKLKSLDGYEQLERLLGRDRWDPDSGRGVLLTSPAWRSDGEQAEKAAVLIAADDRTGIEDVERRLRRVWER